MNVVPSPDLVLALIGSAVAVCSAILLIDLRKGKRRKKPDLTNILKAYANEREGDKFMWKHGYGIKKNNMKGGE